MKTYGAQQSYQTDQTSFTYWNWSGHKIVRKNVFLKNKFGGAPSCAQLHRVHLGTDVEPFFPMSAYHILGGCIHFWSSWKGIEMRTCPYPLSMGSTLFRTFTVEQLQWIFENGPLRLKNVLRILLASGQLHELTNYNLPWLHWDSLVTWDRAMESPPISSLESNPSLRSIGNWFSTSTVFRLHWCFVSCSSRVILVQYHSFPHEMKLTQLVASEKNLYWEGYPWRNEMFTKPTPSSHNENNFTTNFGDGVGVRYAGVWCYNNPNELGYTFCSCKCNI